jgi:hypothetical protein
VRAEVVTDEGQIGSYFGSVAEVGFVAHDEGAPAGERCDQLLLVVAEGNGSVEDQHDDIGVGKGLAGFADADGFGLVFRFAQAGGVNELDGNAAEQRGDRSRGRGWFRAWPLQSRVRAREGG